MQRIPFWKKFTLTSVLLLILISTCNVYNAIFWYWKTPLLWILSSIEHLVYFEIALCQFLTFPPQTISHVSTLIDFPSIFSSRIIFNRSQCAISWDVIILTSNLSHITHFMIAYVMGNHNVEKFSYIENNHFFKRRTLVSFAFARLMMRVLIWQKKMKQVFEFHSYLYQIKVLISANS